jgi:hypothetical protein
MIVGVILILAQQKPRNVIFCRTPEVPIPLKLVVCYQICSQFFLVTQVHIKCDVLYCFVMIIIGLF